MNKTLNVLGIIVAWILSIALVFMLIVTPIVFCALSLLNADTVTKVITGVLTAETAAVQPEETWEVARLTETSEDDASQEAGKNVLQGVFGDKVTQEQMNTILSSKVAKEFIKAYTEDVTNALIGDNKAPQMSAEKIKSIVNNNIDEVVSIIQQIAPEGENINVEELKSKILEAVDKSAEDLIQALPKPEQLRQELMESSPEIEMALNILAKKNIIKLAIIGAIVVLSGLIFVCRLREFTGFRWLAVNMFVGGGFGLFTGVGLLVSGSAVDTIATQSGATVAALAKTLLSAFTTGVFVRTVVMLVAGGLFLTAYILINKQKEKRLLAVEALSEEVPVETAENL